MRRRTLVATLAAAALAGCGGDDDESAAPDRAGENTSPTEAPDAAAPGRPDERPPGEPDGDADTAPAGGREERAAAAPLLRQFRAIREGDARKACAQFSPTGRRNLERDVGGFGEGDASCEDVILDLRVPEGEVSRVEIRGDRGTVFFGGELEYDVERVDGEWKLSG